MSQNFAEKIDLTMSKIGTKCNFKNKIDEENSHKMVFKLLF